MKHTLRLLAAPAAAMLLLASCGTSDEPAPAKDSPAAAASDDGGEAEPSGAASDAGGEEKSSGEIQAEHAKENPEGAPMDDEGTEAGQGNTTTLEFGDETYEMDIDALSSGEYPSTGNYYLDGMTGVQAIAEIGADGPEAMETLRAGYDAEPVTYIRFDVDNREGTEEILMLELNMYDADGQEYTFETFSSIRNDWAEDADYRVTAEQEAAIDELDDLDEGNAAVGQRNVQWLVGPADLPETVSIMDATAEAFIDEFYPMPLL
ncbi:MAG: hypothetical protein ACTIA5_01665 [Brachybacterium tyrofermentans]|uniref:hypothetical protein n=1 Tax=Brachybacterium tyrofermentans TaxID=47848 RepID=UPI003FB807C3